ncbi:hypothetical protein Syun_022756 [Stephania yunnanensis]|uniref:Secreted protein n=1 Tax=Stephania yunnanensis TaxID=152371 RepID=A0AAP0FA32_9MAGN
MSRNHRFMLVLLGCALKKLPYCLSVGESSQSNKASQNFSAWPINPQKKQKVGTLSLANSAQNQLPPLRFIFILMGRGFQTSN